MRTLKLLAFFALTAGPLAAQSILPSSRVTVGGAVGLTSNTLTGDDVQGASRSTGMHAGAEIEVLGLFSFGTSQPGGFGSGVRLGTGIGITQRGGSQSGTGFTDEITTTYVEVPIVLRWVGQRQGAAPVFGAGVITGFNTGCSFEGMSGTTPFSGDCGDDASALFAVTAEGGFRVPYRRGFFTLRAAVDQGLTDMEKNFKARLSSFRIGVGYNIGVSF